ncbi:MAG: cytochrome c oxidase subunit II [Deltaproteobacteria bacterium]|nr:cytochrome c oxidase subunit II [Deltaproteobacteria bacterium]
MSAFEPKKVPPVEIDSFWLPKQASTLAKDIDAGWDAAMLVSIIFFVLVVGLAAYFLVRYKRRSASDVTSEVDHSTKLELTWSVIPLGIVIALFFIGLKGYVNAAVAPAEAYEINVTAAQWSWSFSYPNGTISDELHVPKGRPVRLIMSSTDVVHSFYIPEFRVKSDIIPGQYTTVWFEATEAKETTLFCTEYCGKAHSNMLAKVVIDEEEKFNEWVESGGGTKEVSPAELGKSLHESRCAPCHTIDGTRTIGPSFKGLFGREEALADGSKVMVDENYLRESILEPTKKVVQGYPAAMPTFSGMLTDKQIDALIAFIKTLK